MASTSTANILEFENDNEELETAGDIFKKLMTAWINEKCCPDLLRNQVDLVDCMMDQIKQMEENLKGLSNDDFLVVPHKMEIDRIRFVISSYLRIRLEKIESYSVFLIRRDKSILKEEDKFMSKAEFEFAEKYWESVKKHFRAEVNKYIPPDSGEFEDLDVEVRPNMKSIVTLKMLKPVDGVLIKGTPVNLETNAYHMLPFNDVRNLIESGLAVCI